jgi:hypothetical protein
MSDFHKELLDEIIREWTTNQLNNYITQLEYREIDLKEWIRHLKSIRKKRTKKAPLDTGTRSGI